MYEKKLNFLSNWLWNDSKAYLFLESFLNRVWWDSITLVFAIIALILLFILNYQLWWARYKKFKKNRWKGISNYQDYLEKERIILIIYSVLFSWFILLFFVGWIWLSFLEKLIEWWSYDWVHYPWIAILFGYNLESTVYWYYNIWRYILLLFVFLVTIYIWIMNYSIWSRINIKWEEIRYGPMFNKSLITLLIIYTLLFTVFPDWGLNNIVWIFSDQSIHEIIKWGDSKL